MRRIFFTMLSLIISFGLGVAATLILRKSNTNQPIFQPTPTVVSKCPTASDLIARERYVVISVPSDNEFYIGKKEFLCLRFRKEFGVLRRRNP